MRWLKAIAHRRHDTHDAAEAIHEGDQIGEMVRADEGEVAGVGVVEETILLVWCCERGRSSACAITQGSRYEERHTGLLSDFFGGLVDAIRAGVAFRHVGVAVR